MKTSRSKQETQPGLTTVFHQALRRAGELAETKPVQYALYVGRRMYGNRVYASRAAVKSAALQLINGIIERHGLAPSERIDLETRRQLLDSAIQQELLYIQPCQR